MGLRTRYLDDCVTRALHRGVRQVVILGAGLDTRAARLGREAVRFFEVDQPASQADKRERLSRFEAYPMDAATFVPCDFERDDFVELLETAGLDRKSPACFVWEGVIYYLLEAAARTTLLEHPQRDRFDRRAFCGELAEAGFEPVESEELWGAMAWFVAGAPRAA